MTIEPIGAVRPVPATNEDSRPASVESGATVVTQRRAVEPGGADGLELSRIVPGLLAASGLHPTPAETEALAARYAAARAAVRSLYAVPEARYEDPGSIFRAAL